MWKTVLFLLFTLIIVPVVTFNFDDPLTALQQASLSKVFWIYLVSALSCFVLSTITQNYSQVDKLWSVIPMVYVWVICADSGFEPRLVLMASLVSIWAIRLTYNFGRRGGYSLKFWEGEEDYRWSILRAKPEFQATWKWMLFNLFFISLYQMGLILLFTLPILKSMEAGPLGIADYLLAVVFVGFVGIEYLSDQQQWDFQNEKHALRKENKNLKGDFKNGFLTSGLWGIVRHPNYAAEQAIWIVFYCFSIVATGNWINWSIAGCLLLVILFKGSSDFSEEISAEKYPAYQSYQKAVPRFIPFLKGAVKSKELSVE